MTLSIRDLTEKALFHEEELTADEKAVIDEHRKKQSEVEKHIASWVEAGIDCKGHFQVDTDPLSKAKVESERYTSMIRYLIGAEVVEILYNHLSGKRDNRKPTTTLMSPYSDCFVCGEEVRFEYTPKGLIAVDTCPLPDGYPEFSVKLNVPSGQLVFDNDFRGLFPDVSIEYNVNQTINTHRTSAAWADEGMIHHYVGNTCPGIYRQEDGSLHIISGGYNEDTDENIEPAGVSVGGICTDLWWYSAMDADKFRELAGDKAEEWLKKLTVVDVGPGCYDASGRTHIVRSDLSYRDEELFSVIRRIGPVQELAPQSCNHQTKEKLKNLETAMKVARMSWPTLYKSRAEVLNQWYCTLGGGISWVDGTLIRVGEKEEAALEKLEAGIEPPPINNSHGHGGRAFYPMAEKYANLINVPDNIQIDWLFGIFETVELIMKTDPYGVGTGGHTYIKNIILAKKSFRALRERFAEKLNQYFESNPEQLKEIENSDGPPIWTPQALDRIENLCQKADAIEKDALKITKPKVEKIIAEHKAFCDENEKIRKQRAKVKKE